MNPSGRPGLNKAAMLRSTVMCCSESQRFARLWTGVDERTPRQLNSHRRGGQLPVPPALDDQQGTPDERGAVSNQARCVEM